MKLLKGIKLVQKLNEDGLSITEIVQILAQEKYYHKVVANIGKCT